MKNAFWKSSFCSRNIQFFVFPFFFFPVGNRFRRWSKINLKVHDIINCLNKNLITFCLISWEVKKSLTLKLSQLIDYIIETFLWKNHAENVHQKLIPDPLLMLVKNPKQPLHVRNVFRNKIFWKTIIKKP